MTPDELTALGMLRGVKFTTPSWEQRTSKHLFRMATPPPTPVCNCVVLGTEQKVFWKNHPAYAPTHAPDCPVAVAASWQPMITKKDGHQLWRLLFRSRRHLKHPQRAKFLRTAEKLMVPDYQTYEYRKEQEARYKAKARKEAV